MSAKGGVGKSTISLLLGKALAELGDDVLIIDRDPLAYVSNVFGVRGQGIIQSVMEGKPPRDYVKIVGNLTILKCFGQGPRYVVDLEKLSKSRELLDRACNTYLDAVLQKDYKFYIVDNPSLVLVEDPIVEMELNTFLKAKPKESVVRIYVTDPIDYTIKLTLEYLDKVEESKPIGKPYALIINLVPPFKDVLESTELKLKGIISEKGFEEGAVIPFSEELFNLSSADVEVPNEVKRLALKIREKARRSS
ncbi:MAG: ParA family protein [Candidatus Aramenus sp.]|nr:ParA family protein [Candidatus Aramenus sp.]